MQGAGDHRAAIAAYREVLAADPHDARTLRYLGLALQVVGDARGAREALSAACEHAPHDADAHAALGWWHAGRREFAEAERCYAAAAANAPTEAAHWKSLGSVQHARGDLAGAARSLRAALDRDPRSAPIAFALGNVLADDGRVDDAIAYLRLAVELDAGQSAFHNNLGIQLQYAGDVTAALVHFRRALELAPDNREARLNLGKCHVALGDGVAADREYRALLASQPEDASALAALVERQGRSAGADDVALAESLAARPQPLGVRLKLHYALARHHDAAGRFDAAFAHAARYNAAVRERAYAVPDFDAQHARLVAAFDADRVARLGAHGHPTDALVFVVGMPRSGTTLVESILARHPRVRAAGELQHLERLARDMPILFPGGDAYPECVAALDAPRIARLAATYLDAIAPHEPGPYRVTDKLPMNFVHVGLIAVLFPNSRIVYCHRNAADTCVSCLFEDFGAQYAFMADQRATARYYRFHARLMEHWLRIVPSRIHTVRYEQIVADQAGSTRALLEFLGLEWHDDCLEFHRGDRAILTPSRDQVRQPIYGRSVGRWRNYEAHLGPLLESLREEPRPRLVEL